MPSLDQKHTLPKQAFFKPIIKEKFDRYHAPCVTYHAARQIQARNLKASEADRVTTILSKDGQTLITAYNRQRKNKRGPAALTASFVHAPNARKGQVKWFHKNKGYGFLTNGVFVHHSLLNRAPEKDETLYYTLAKPDKVPQATKQAMQGLPKAVVRPRVRKPRNARLLDYM